VLDEISYFAVKGKRAEKKEGSFAPSDSPPPPPSIKAFTLTGFARLACTGIELPASQARTEWGRYWSKLHAGPDNPSGSVCICVDRATL